MIRAGTKLSYYVIQSPLGAGAMGEVWRARDTRLDRDVAIKVLPEHFAEDAERLKRFEREAKTLASLNHPNVAQIFGVDQVGDVCFLVLEFVPGESLEERLRRGPLPLDEALDVCRQIADGLEAAHEAGVVHRDLKPANVLLAPDGKVKVLDFGLAKPMPDARESKSPTGSALSTEQGRLLGTPTYMAPEQARGKPIDRRVDIWAFGCVLYECLTARRAFDGETLSDVLASVLDKDPDLARLPSATPRSVRALIARCLAKDARQRLRDAGDARLELEFPAETRERELQRPVGTRAVVLAILCAAVLLFGGLWWHALRSAGAAPPSDSPAHLAIRLPLGMELYGSANSEQNQILALSPDGSHIAFVAVEDGQRRLYLRSLDSPAVTALPGSEDAICPFFSPDGTWLAFGARGKLYKTPAGPGSIGQPTQICASGPTRGGAWGPDGSIVFSPDTTSGLLRLPPGGGATVELTRPDIARGERSHRWPTFLPGGDEVAFTVGAAGKSGDYDASDIDAVSLSTGKRRSLVRGASFVRVLDQDRLLFARNGQLFALPADRLHGEPLGSAVPVLEGVAGVPTSGVVFFDVSKSGTLAYVQHDPRASDFELAWVARDGAIEPLPLPAREYRTPRISPDGKRLALAIGPGGGRGSDLWMVDLVRGSASRLTFDQRSYSPVWSRDGERVAFLAPFGGKAAFAWKRADGTKDSERIAEFDDQIPRYPLAFMSDGDGLLFITQGSAATAQDLFCWSLRDARSIAFAQTPASEQYAALSPDGAWLAYVSDVSGKREVYVQDFPEHRGRWQISEAAIAPCWSRDQRELIVVKGRQILAVPVETSPSFSSGEPRVVANLDFMPTEESMTNYDVGPDGRLLVVRGTSKESYLGHLNVVLHWAAELRGQASR